jgi:hypothetical protein
LHQAIWPSVPDAESSPRNGSASIDDPTRIVIPRSPPRRTTRDPSGFTLPLTSMVKWGRGFDTVRHRRPAPALPKPPSSTQSMFTRDPSYLLQKINMMSFRMNTLRCSGSTMKTRTFNPFEMKTLRTPCGVSPADTHTYQNDRGGVPPSRIKIHEAQISPATAESRGLSGAGQHLCPYIDTLPARRIITVAKGGYRRTRAAAGGRIGAPAPPRSVRTLRPARGKGSRQGALCRARKVMA